MIQTIVFDFGNVVGFFDHRRASNRLAQYTPMPADTLHALLFSGALEDDYESGRISTAVFLRRLRETCRFHCSDDVVAGAYADIFWPNPDVCSLLPRLKPGFRLLLGSNTTPLHAGKFRCQFAETLKVFDGLVLSYEIGVRKPKGEFFKYCQHLAGCAPGECLFIDDLPANVAGAKACGWNGMVYTGIDDLRRELAGLDIVI